MVIRQLSLCYICIYKSQVHLLNCPCWTLSALPLFFPLLSECRANHQLVFLCSDTLPSWEILGNKTIRSEWDRANCYWVVLLIFCCLVCRNALHFALHSKTDCIGCMRAALAASFLTIMWIYFLTLHNKQCILACSRDRWMKDCICSINTLFYCFLVP